MGALRLDGPQQLLSDKASLLGLRAAPDLAGLGTASSVSGANDTGSVVTLPHPAQANSQKLFLPGAPPPRPPDAASHLHEAQLGAGSEAHGRVWPGQPCSPTSFWPLVSQHVTSVQWGWEAEGSEPAPHLPEVRDHNGHDIQGKGR